MVNSSNSSSGRYTPNKERLDNDFLDGPPPVVEASDTEVRDMIKQYRTELVHRLLALWHESYSTLNNEKDMQQAIDITANNIQRLDIILRLTAPQEEKKNSGGYT